jgi:hypothetical protein
LYVVNAPVGKKLVEQSSARLRDRLDEPSTFNGDNGFSHALIRFARSAFNQPKTP